MSRKERDREGERRRCTCMSDWMIIFNFLKRNSYLYHKGEPQRDEEIDGEERNGEGGKSETMYVCMYVYGYG